MTRFGGFAFALMLAFATTLSGQEGLKVGDKAVDFELPSLGGKKVKLSDNFGNDGNTTILVFSRANW